MAGYASTFVGRRWPEGDASPALLFLKGQVYDRFEPVPVREKSRLPFLREIARRVQEVNRQRYAAWHERFRTACERLGAEPPLVAATWWRLVAGWATNPTLEVGLTLDPLLGFPFVPGSAVKGLLHRVAEMELLEEPGGVPRPAAPALPPSPPPELLAALGRALQVRALFGSLAARRDGGTDQPEAPFDRLRAWLDLIEPERDPEGRPPAAWEGAAADLDLLCGDRATGGLVTCFDAVPAPEVFAIGGNLLEPDVLTPHTEGKPNPIPFLAVRAGAAFELRFRLAALPAAAGDLRDDEEAFRRSALAGASREELLERLRTWLLRGLAEHGLGGKTAAGYGYLLQGERPKPPPPAPPPAPEPEEELPPAERYARGVLPDDLDPSHLANALDKAIGEGDPEQLAAVARRFAERYPDLVAGWRERRNARAIQKRLQALGLDRDDGSAEGGG